MDYEVVNLEEKIVAGLTARTNNQSPDMGAVIGNLWQSFYQNGIYEKIPEKRNEKAIGLYSDYAGNEKDDYDVTVGCEVDSGENLPSGICVKRIPSGAYARFIVQGDMHQAVAEFWEQLWEMELNRAFLSDFEEYQNGDMEHAVIHVYISLK